MIQVLMFFNFRRTLETIQFFFDNYYFIAIKGCLHWFNILKLFKKVPDANDIINELLMILITIRAHLHGFEIWL